jgi:proline iminopeptidase
MLLRVNGTRLFFDVVGASLLPEGREMRKRPTLVLLHGGPGADHSLYRPGFDALGDVAQVIYLDQRGQGRSDPDQREHWNLAQWGDDVRGFCDALGIERPVVLGHSFGGMVAMMYAVRHPEHPGGLVLSATYARQNIERIAARCTELGGAAVGAAARRMWSEPSPESMAQYDRQVLRYYARTPIDETAMQGAFRMRRRSQVGLHFAAGEMQRFNLLPELYRVQCPTLVLGGSLDPVCPIEDQEDIVRALPSEHAELHRFEGAGHMLWIDDEKRYFELLRAFLRRAVGGT